MANPFDSSRAFYKVGHITNTPPWKVLPTPNGLGMVTTKGRKTGKPRQRAMRVVRNGDRAYAVALLGGRSDWLRNLRADPNVRVKLGRTTYDAIAHEVTDADERVRFADAYRPIAGWFDYFDYANFVWSFPTRGKLLRAHDGWMERGTPVVFELKLR